MDKKPTNFIKYLLILAVFFGYLRNVNAQSAGDFRSISSGLWSNVANWETFDGTIWVAATLVPESTDGIITIQTGTDIEQDDFLGIDQVVVETGATLELTGVTTVNDGAGTDLLVNGILNVSSVTVGSSTSTILISSTGVMNWADDQIAVPVTVNSGGIINATNNSTKKFKYTWTIAAGATFNLNYNGILAFSSSILNNNGSINLTGDVDFSVGSGSPVFNNNATGNFTKSTSAGISNLGVFTANTGSIIINSGTLATSNTFNSTGSINVNSGTTFENTTNTATFSSGSFSVTGTLSVMGTFQQNASIFFDPNASLNIASGGTYNMNANQTTASGYSLGLSGLNIEGNLFIASGKVVDWTSGIIGINTGATLTNNGTFNAKFDGSIQNLGGGTFYNSTLGIFNKAAGVGTTTIEVLFTNDGTVNVNTGTLLAQGDFNNNSGKLITISSGATFSNSGIMTDDGSITVNMGGSILSAGTFNQNQSITFSGTSNLIVTSAHNLNADQTWAAGLNVAINGGTLTNASGKILTLTVTNIDFNGGTFENNGSIDDNANTKFHKVAGTNNFHNNASGTFNKLGGSGNSVFETDVLNNGTFNAVVGGIATRVFVHNGTMTITGAKLASNGTFTQNSPISFTSASTFLIKGIHNMNSDQDFNSGLGTITLDGGQLNIASGKTLNWSATSIDQLNTSKLTNNGTIDNSFDGTISNGAGSNQFINNGTFSKSGSGGTTSIDVAYVPGSSSVLKGNGTIDFGANAYSSTGTISPGLSPGDLTLDGTSNPLSASTTLAIELTPASSDVLNRNASITIGGTLNATGSFNYGTVSIVTASSVSGTFSSVTLPGPEYTLSYTGTTVDIVRAPLPVELVAFTGESRNATNMLKWETASESNTKMFILERATQNNVFNTLGEVAAAGNTNIASHYNFTDAKPMADAYYRLKIVDFDGSFEYSKIIRLQNADASAVKVELYPVPANNTMNLNFESIADDNVQLKIIGVNGQILTTMDLEVSKGQNKNIIDVSSLPVGMYHLIISGRNIEKNLPFIKN